MKKREKKKREKEKNQPAQRQIPHFPKESSAFPETDNC